MSVLVGDGRPEVAVVNFAERPLDHRSDRQAATTGALGQSVTHHPGDPDRRGLGHTNTVNRTVHMRRPAAESSRARSCSSEEDIIRPGGPTVSCMSGVELRVEGFRVEPLSPLTWDAYADLAERHNGVWGGCWCTWFHQFPDPPERATLGNREFKRRLVEDDRTHAALVFDGAEAIAWAQFGPVLELQNIHHRKQWEQGVIHVPDFRITCLFVDRRYRRKGMAAIAVQGAMALIAAAGGGLVESYPHDLVPGKKTSASFLYNATRSMYEQLGFSYDRPKGKGNCVMTKVITADGPARAMGTASENG